MSDADPQDEAAEPEPVAPHMPTGHGSPGAAVAAHFRLALGEECPICGALGIGNVRNE